MTSSCAKLNYYFIIFLEIPSFQKIVKLIHTLEEIHKLNIAQMYKFKSIGSTFFYSFNEKIFYVMLFFKNSLSTPQSCQNWILQMIFHSCELSHVNFELPNIKKFLSNLINMCNYFLSPFSLNRLFASLACRAMISLGSSAVEQFRHQRS